MKFSSLFIPTALAFLRLSTAQTSEETLQYDPAYDIGSSSLSTVACSDGPNGLLTKGYTTFDSLPSFPNIGAFGQVEGYDSVNCGTCWQVTYGSNTLNILAIDHAGEGLINASEEAMNTLTDNNAVGIGAAPVSVVQVPASACGL